MDKTEADYQRGRRAKEIAEDPLFSEASAHIEAELWRLFSECALTDIDAMAQIKAMQYVHLKYLAFLNRCINDGNVARMDIERKPRHTRQEFGL
jgi:hypothetical protein